MKRQSRPNRKMQVLEYLRIREGLWVDGPELANVEVGGSEGLKRLRELRADGWQIEERRHPNPDRDSWQYRLLPKGAKANVVITVLPWARCFFELPRNVSDYREHAQRQRTDGSWRCMVCHPAVASLAPSVAKVKINAAGIEAYIEWTKTHPSVWDTARG